MSGEKKVQTLNELSPIQVKQVVYENRILHVKKKFTIPSQLVSSEKKSVNLLERTKKSGDFSKFIHNIVSNRHLCRRGPFDLPFPPDALQPKSKRLKTDTGLSKEILFSRRRLKTQKRTQQSNQKITWAKLKQIEAKQKRELPLLKSSRYEHQEMMPIKVQKFVSKSATRGYCLSPEEARRQKKNIMLRKLDVQLLNYQLLGKIVTTRT